MSKYRITVDTGGTFSDFVYWNESSGEISIGKIPSTPDDPSRAILSGISNLLKGGVNPEQINYFCHGTTVGTNALLEGKGAKTGLLVTEGFRGIYEVGEQARPHGAAIFDIMYDRPAMLASEDTTIEVKERISFDGKVLTNLDETLLRHELITLINKNVESIAVCLLFSFLNPQHEQRVREIIHDVLPACNVSLSSDIIPQIREYYRLSTTVINAYLQPILARYIEKLEDVLVNAGIHSRQAYIMQSNGGMATFQATAKKAVTTVLSGPAGGVTASVKTSQSTGYRNIITFDMGGTSCDVALIKDGEPSLRNRGKIEGRDISVPMMDINTVSAGGGTISRVDQQGVLQVGPDSAGAVPGPACYARGGVLPTITDCNLVLGFLSVDNFLGGGMRLDARAAATAVETFIARPLNIPITAAAEGVIRIINVKMEEAIKAISTMQGHDLRDFMLLAYGGAGPIHAGKIFQELGMAGMIVPRYPGVHSAMGLLMSNVKHDYVRSRISILAALTNNDIQEVFESLKIDALKELETEGFTKNNIELHFGLDLRYAGQGYEITLDCDPYAAHGVTAGLREKFDTAHKTMFGHNAPNEQIEVISYRVQGVGLVPAISLPKAVPTGIPLEAARREVRQVCFDGVMHECPVYERERLDIGLAFLGPAIIEQLDCTIVAYPGQAVQIDEYQNLIMTGAGLC
ncbi:MAG: hypothetical protein B7Z75_02390 [Acidocella sp. 20-57-95]|nr:MAG: hypothetical protein B7Z75_02390 [Acidocella sp. 20-57-95]HQT63853.1 hydantoinase/oxoprolinase family protein [Acidocella sp.]